MTPEGASSQEPVAPAPTEASAPAVPAMPALRGPRRVLPAQNAALETYVAERQAHQAAAPGQCAICRTRPARASCLGCAAKVCLAHRWTMFGLCKECLRPGDLRRWHQAGRPEETNWLTNG